MPLTQLGRLIARIRDIRDIRKFSAWADQQEEERDELDRAQRGFQLYGLGDATSSSGLNHLDPNDRLTYTLLASPFADEWYRMREVGEHDRAAALSELYTRRRQPGGSHPDPRAPAAFSSRAIIAAAARLKGLTIWPVPPDTGSHKDPQDPRAEAIKPAHSPVWLITYPLGRSGARRMPHIAVTQQDEEQLMLWYIACMMGLIAREPHRITDPHVPAGVTTLPTDPMARALIHRYAHALMLVDFNCSQAFGCACASIEAQLNAPPPDHPQPTQTLPAQRVKPVINTPAPPSPPADRSATDPTNPRQRKQSNPLEGSS